MMKLISTLSAIICVTAGAFGQTLRVGDDAPALKVSKWVKGEPVGSFDKGRVYVVEFWATWCPPCVKSIPHLSELQAEHAEHATFIGMTSEDRRNTLGKVEAFVNDWGDKMAYTVAFDDGRATNNAYMAAAGQNGIPTAFVVDQAGKLVWIGNPLDAAFDGVVEKVIAGEFDGVKEAVERNRVAELQKEAMGLMQAAGAAHQAGDMETVLVKLDEIIALDNEVFGQVVISKINILMVDMGDVDAANAYAALATVTILADQSELLNLLAQYMVTEGKKAGEPNLDVALAAADRANELSDGENVAFLDTLATVHWERGEKADAVAVAERAVAAADEGDRPALEAKLETYRGG